MLLYAIILRTKTRLAAKSSEAADWKEGAHGPPTLGSHLLQFVNALLSPRRFPLHSHPIFLYLNK